MEREYNGYGILIPYKDFLEFEKWHSGMAYTVAFGRGCGGERQYWVLTESETIQRLNNEIERLKKDNADLVIQFHVKNIKKWYQFWK